MTTTTLSSSSIGVGVVDRNDNDFRVDRSLFVMLGFHVSIMTFSVEMQYHEPLFSLLIFVVYGPVLAATILIHEYAHATTKRHFRNLPKDDDDTTCSSVYQELVCVTSGPLSHIPQAMFWFGIFSKLTTGDSNYLVGGGTIQEFLIVDMDNLREGGAVAFMSTLAMQATVMNIVMLQLNLAIPVHPFPGARALVASLVLCGASLSTAGLVTSMCGMTVGLLAFWAGVFLWFLHHTVIASCLGALASFAMFSSARLLRMSLGCGSSSRSSVQEHVLFQQSCYQPAASGEQKTLEMTPTSNCDDEQIYIMT